MKNNTKIFPLLILFIIAASVVSCASKTKGVNTKHAEALRNLGEAYMRQGNYSAALSELLKAEKITPNDPFLQNDLGRTYFAKERIDTAIIHFQKAIKIKPDYAPAINNLGSAYLAKKDWDAAIQTFRDLSTNLLYGTPPISALNLGYAYYNKEMYTLAEENYLAALDLEPKFIIALRGLGKTYLKMGKLAEAISTFEKAVSITPNYAELHSDLAKAYIASRNFEKASFEISKVLELAPSDGSLYIEATEIAEKLKLKTSRQ